MDHRLQLAAGWLVDTGKHGEFARTRAGIVTVAIPRTNIGRTKGEPALQAPAGQKIRVLPIMYASEQRAPGRSMMIKLGG